MIEEFDKLATTIRAKANGRQIIYVPNPGNFGDGLIRHATKVFFHDYDIPHLEINVGFRGGKLVLTPALIENVFRQNYFFIYGGGGAWHSKYQFGKTIVDFIATATSHYLVLPSTYEIFPVNAKGTFFRRDQYQSKIRAPQSKFCHDMAFYLVATGQLLGGDSKKPVHKNGFLFRRDAESDTDSNLLPASNVDLSLEGNHMSPADIFVHRVAQYEIINTDRLHVSIAGCLCKRRVNLVTGSYFKIQAIYNSSMADQFENVRLFKDADNLLCQTDD